MTKPQVICICATKSRVTHLQRVIRCFLNQVYEGQHMLFIYNNSHIPQTLGDFPIPENKSIVLINNNIDYKTKKPYDSVGAIYNDILRYLPNIPGLIINHFDDDDIYLPNHISAGVEGLLKSGKKAYKPKASWFLYNGQVKEASNVNEPSIFVKLSHLKEAGYNLTTSCQHLGWINPLVQTGELAIDPEGEKTFIYRWGQGTWHISGDPKNPSNFKNFENNSQDNGNGTLMPAPKEEVDIFYNMIK